MSQNSMILVEEAKLQLQLILTNREIINSKDPKLDLQLHNEQNHSIDQEATLQVNKETINLINQDQSDLNQDHSIQIDQKWILPNRNLNLDHIEVWENQMEEPKIDSNAERSKWSVFLF